MYVQGYENEVLKRAFTTLQKCKTVMSELSLEPLYQGSSSFGSVYQTLNSAGFFSIFSTRLRA